MKNFLLLVAILISAIGSAQPEKDIEVAITKFFDGFSSDSFESIKSMSTENVIIVEHDVLWTIDSLKKHMSKPKPADYKRINKLTFLNVEVDGNTAWATYDNVAEITGNAKQYTLHWLETAVLSKLNGQWKVATLHSTTLERKKK